MPQHHCGAFAPGDVHAPRRAHGRGKHIRNRIDTRGLVVRRARLRIHGSQQPVIGLQEIQNAVVEQRRGHVRRVAIHRPRHRRRAGDVAFRVGQPDRLGAVAAEAAHQERERAVGDRRGNHVHREPGGFPDHVARGQVVARDLVHRGHDHLRLAVHRRDERRGPRVDLRARLPPDLIARSLVECGHERFALVIPDDHQRVAVQRRRAAFAERAAHALVAEILLPHQLAGHVVGVQAARLERRDHVLTVHDGRGRGPRAVLRMRGFVRRLFARRLLPDRLSRLPIDRQHHIAMGNEWLAAKRRVLRVCGHPHGYGRQHVEAITPYDGRPRTAARHLHLPADVLRFTPFGGRCCRAGHARALRSAPLRPVTLARCGLEGGVKRREERQ